MRKVILTGATLGAGYGFFTYYKNHIKQAPEAAKLYEKPHKKVVVLGAGIVGLSTAYYLS